MAGLRSYGYNVVIGYPSSTCRSRSQTYQPLKSIPACGNQKHNDSASGSHKPGLNSTAGSQNVRSGEIQVRNYIS